MRHGLRAGVDPLIIFLSIGVLIATWIFSGTIPTIMYFGFEIISVKFFLPTVFIVVPLLGLLVEVHLLLYQQWESPLLALAQLLKLTPV